MKLTKSKYVQFMMCKRKAWLDLYDHMDSEESERAKEGKLVGEVAHKLLGDAIIIEQGELNPPTAAGLYAEYPLIYNDLLCLVDLLKINNDGSIDIYEVKSSTNWLNTSTAKEGIPLDKYFHDISFQYYVATKLNKTVNTVNLVTLNKEYIYDGVNLDLNQLFLINDYKHLLINNIDEVESNVKEYFNLDINKEIKCKFSSFCNANDGCLYLQKCKDYHNLTGKLDLYNIFKSSTNKYINKNITNINELYNDIKEYNDLNNFMKMVIDYNVNNNDKPYVNKKELKEFLNKLEYPLYFFDFESTQIYVPQFKNSRPIQQIPFQYSLHIMNSKDDTFEQVVKNHEEYLGDGVTDPRIELVNRMIKDLSTKGSIIAYFDGFERKIIESLVADFPLYKNELLNIKNRFVDLRKPFNSRVDKFKDPVTSKNVEETRITVYQKDMGKRSSIKVVLPAFFPNNPEYNYSNLKQIHNGQEASSAYKKLSDLPKEEKEELRENMLKYCCLDTKAMVALYFKLKELSDNK